MADRPLFSSFPPSPRTPGLRVRKRPGRPRKGRGASALPTRPEGPDTHASATQLVTLHHRGPGAELRRPPCAGQPSRAAADHQVVEGSGGRGRGLQLARTRHGASERAHRPPQARGRAHAQCPGQQRHARKCALGSGCSVGVTKHPRRGGRRANVPTPRLAPAPQRVDRDSRKQTFCLPPASPDPLLHCPALLDLDSRSASLRAGDRNLNIFKSHFFLFNVILLYF